MRCLLAAMCCLLAAGPILAQSDIGIDDVGGHCPPTNLEQTSEGLATAPAPSPDALLSAPTPAPQPTVIQRVTRPVRNIYHTRVIRVSEVPEGWKREEPLEYAEKAVDEHLFGRKQEDGSNEMDAGGPMLREEGAALADRTLTKAGKNADAKVNDERNEREAADQDLLSRIMDSWLGLVLLGIAIILILAVVVGVVLVLLAAA